jgi:hypothetical protein
VKSRTKSARAAVPYKCTIFRFANLDSHLQFLAFKPCPLNVLTGFILNGVGVSEEANTKSHAPDVPSNFKLTLTSPTTAHVRFGWGGTDVQKQGLHFLVEVRVGDQPVCGGGG